MTLWLAFPICVFATSTISGALGMGGGSILMGVYAWSLPVAGAMILHGLTQLAANGSRALLHRRAVMWQVVAPYLVGSAVSVGIFSWAAFIPSPALVFLALGALPFVKWLIPGSLGLDVRRKPVAVACGASVTAFQLFSGASGATLDVFFLNPNLTKEQVVATKAVTQTLGHATKLAYYGFAAFHGTADLGFPLWLALLLMGMATAGSMAGKWILSRLSEKNFRLLTGSLIAVIGAVFLVRGVWLL